MSPPSPPAAPKNAAVPESPPSAPPDEQFWVRYSPHHEFPLSSVGTLCLYAVLAILIWVAAKFLPLLLTNTEPIPVEPIEVVDSGGGGDPNGTGAGPGKEQPTEDLPQENPQDLANKYKPPVSLADLPKPQISPDQFQEVDAKDVEALRLIEQGNQSAATLGKVGERARAQLMQPLRASAGQGGNGSGGGNGNGNGTGTSNGQGSGKMLTERQKRVLRWTMIFDTRSGDDYRIQLLAMGAILGIPDPDGQYRVVRDLRQKPAQPRVEDLKKINRIFWIDERPDSIGPLCKALGIPKPAHVVAFFPEKLEKELLRKEQAFAGRKEHEIQQTRFRVVRRGPGYEAIVVEQQ